jgi:tetratricopeptide (TPR) repeat protein
MGRFDEALADLDAAADIMPRSADVLYLRALTRRHLGRTAEAAADMTAATMFDKQIAATYARYGVTG